MSYNTQTDAVKDLEKASLAVLGQKIVSNAGVVQTIDVYMLCEETENARQYVQPIYVRNSDGKTWLGPICRPVQEYLTVKKEIVDNSDYRGLSASAIVTALNKKMVRKQPGTMISWQSIQSAIGLQRTIEVKAQLDAISTSTVAAVVTELNKVLDPEKGVGVDPSLDEFRKQVDTMGVLTDLTTDEKNKIKGIGEVKWTSMYNITVREWQIKNIIG